MTAIYDRFEYHDWMMNMDPAPIRLQKHIVVHGQNLGKENPCPIEYRNIFIKELKASDPKPRAADKKLNVPPEGFTALFNGRDFTGWGRSRMGCSHRTALARQICSPRRSIGTLC